MNNDEAIRRAERAKQLLADPMIKESLDLIESEIIEQWAACPVRDVEGREILWRLYMSAQKFRGILVGTVQNGKVAEFREQQSAADKMVNIFKGKKNG